MAERTLPNLPGSTAEDLKRNEFHPFFRKTAKEVWAQASIEQIVLKPKPPCDHYFRYVKNGVLCNKCFMGLQGHIDIKKGKLFYKGQAILH